MKYYIMEVQKSINGAFAYLMDSADTFNSAESIFYDKCHYAAVSTLPVHTIMLLDSDGAMYMSKTWRREVASE